jgi:hypothetical protein
MGSMPTISQGGIAFFPVILPAVRDKTSTGTNGIEHNRTLHLRLRTLPERRVHRIVFRMRYRQTRLVGT